MFSAEMCEDYRKFSYKISLKEYFDQSDTQMAQFLENGPFISLVNAEDWIYYGSGIF